MYTIKQSTATTIPIFIHDANGDAVTGLVDGGFTKRISKGSGAFGAMTVTITEMENGWYSVPFSSSHSDTLGILTTTLIPASGKQVNLQFRVEAKLVDTLQDLTAAQVNAEVDTGITDAALATAASLATAQLDLDTITGADGAILASTATSAQLVDDIYDEATSGHNVSGSFGKASRQVKEAVLSEESTVNDAGATTTVFITSLTETTDDHYKDVSIVFIDGALTGQSRPVFGYNGTTKAITLDEALTEAPANGDGFILKTDHVHPVTQIQSGLATEAKQDIIDANVDLVLEDTGTTIPAILGTPAGADMSADIAAIKADTATILIDTNELQGDWTDGGRLDLIVDSILDDTGTSGVLLTSTERNAIADAILDRDMSTGADSGSTTVRTVRQALRSNRNKVSISGGTMTVTKEDDTTVSWTAAVATTAGDPISSIDPAG